MLISLWTPDAAHCRRIRDFQVPELYFDLETDIIQRCKKLQQFGQTNGLPIKQDKVSNSNCRASAIFTFLRKDFFPISVSVHYKQQMCCKNQTDLSKQTQLLSCTHLPKQICYFFFSLSLLSCWLLRNRRVVEHQSNSFPKAFLQRER